MDAFVEILLGLTLAGIVVFTCMAEALEEEKG